MFDTGTRVVVLASSTKKGFGPKRGSIGYVSSQQPTSFIHHMNPHDSLSFLSMPITVAFSRYGFEEKRRCEFRTVINVLPVIVEELKNISSKIEDIIGLFQNDEFEKNRRWEDWVSNKYNIPGPKLVVLSPVGSLKTENMLDQPMEVQAYVESFLRNPLIGKSLNANRNSDFHPQIDKDFMALVARAHRSRSTTQEVLKWAELNQERALSNIRTLSTVYNLRSRKQELDHFKRSVEAGRYGGEDKGGYGAPNFHFNPFFSTYTLGFFEEDKIKEKEVIAEKSKSAQICNIAKGMRYVRSAITELASKTIAKE